MKKFKDFKLEKSSCANVFGGIEGDEEGTWQKTYAKNDPEKTTFWKDYVD